MVLILPVCLKFYSNGKVQPSIVSGTEMEKNTVQVVYAEHLSYFTSGVVASVCFKLCFLF